MIVTDSRTDGGPGFLPFQDHTSSRGREADLEGRFQLLGIRKVGRKDKQGEYGHIIHQRGSIGDVPNAFLWRESNRYAPSWSFVFAAKTSSALEETVTVAKGPRDNGPRDRGGKGPGVDKDGAGGAPEKKVQGAAASGGGTGPNPDAPRGIGGIGGKNIFGPTFGAGDPGNGVGYVSVQGDPSAVGLKVPGGSSRGQGSATRSLFGIFGSARPVLLHDSENLERYGYNADSKSKGAAKNGVAAWIRGYAEYKTPPRLRPTQGEGWNQDRRYKVLLATQPTLWPQMPENWHGLTVAGLNEDRQVEYFHPTDPRIPLVHNGGIAISGALACDMRDENEPDPERHARLHSMLRILKAPPGARNVVAWNLTTSGKGDTRGGYMIDRAEGERSKSKRAPTSGTRGGTRRISGKFRGPVGGILPGRQGRSSKKSSLVVALASHNDGGILHPGIPDDKHQISWDGDGNPINPLHFNILGNFINPDRDNEDGPLRLRSFFEYGDAFEFPVQVKFAWNAFVQKFDWYTWSAEEEVPRPPPDTPTTPREPTTPPPPVDTPPEPPTTPVDPRNPTTPGDDFPPAPNPVNPPVGGGGQPPSVGAGGGQGGGSAYNLARVHTRRWMEASFAAISFRAPRWGDGLPDLIHSRGDGRNPPGPMVLRMDTFAKQPAGLGGAHGLTRPANLGPYLGGTADGGTWLLPPEVSGEDYSADFTYDARDISTSYFGVGPGVCLGFGAPNIETGGVRDGWSMASESSQLKFRSHIADGSGTEFFRLTNEGAIWIPELAGDPANPDAGFVALYAKSGDLFQKDSAGVVTSLV